MVGSITYCSTCFSLIIVKGFVVLTQSCIFCLQGISWVLMTIDFRLQIIDIYCCGYCWQTNYSRNQKRLLEENLSIIKMMNTDSKIVRLDEIKYKKKHCYPDLQTWWYLIVTIRSLRYTWIKAVEVVCVVIICSQPISIKISNINVINDWYLDKFNKISMDGF